MQKNYSKQLINKPLEKANSIEIGDEVGNTMFSQIKSVTL